MTTEAPPEGCAMATVSSKCEVHIMLKGLIDISKEIAKLETKQKTLDGQLKKLNEAVSKPDYSSKVPEKVRSQNSEKMSQLEVEIEKICSAIQGLMKVEEMRPAATNGHAPSNGAAPFSRFINIELCKGKP